MQFSIYGSMLMENNKVRIRFIIIQCWIEKLMEIAKNFTPILLYDIQYTCTEF